MKRYKTTILSIFMVILSFSLISSGLLGTTNSSPVIENVIITLGDSYDPAISKAVTSLTQDLPDAMVLQYGSSEYIWNTAFRPVYNYIIVGHGSENFVEVNSQQMTWFDFSEIINQLTPINKIHFLNCNSANINQFISKNKLGYSFPGMIDASIGGAILASFINAELKRSSLTKNAIDRVFGYIQEYSSGLAKMSFLRLDAGGGGGGGTTTCSPYNSPDEFGWGSLGLALTVAINIIMLQSFAGLIEKYQNPTITSVNQLVGRTSLLEKLRYAVGLSLDSSGPLAAVYAAEIGEFNVDKLLAIGWSLLMIAVTTIPIMVDLLFGYFDWFDMMFSVAAITAAVALMFVDVESGGVTFFLKLVAAAWPTYKAIRNIMYNVEDCNGTWEPQYTGIFGLIQLL